MGHRFVDGEEGGVRLERGEDVSPVAAQPDCIEIRTDIGRTVVVRAPVDADRRPRLQPGDETTDGVVVEYVTRTRQRAELPHESRWLARRDHRLGDRSADGEADARQRDEGRDHYGHAGSGG